MALDLTQHKIATFTGINDQPVEPTTARAGNGSHLIASHNNALDALATHINDRSAVLTASWQIVQGYTAPDLNSKVLCLDDGNSSMVVQIPVTAAEGSFFQIMSTNSTVVVQIIASDGSYGFAGTSAQFVTFSSQYEIVELVYTSSLGWVPSKPLEYFTITPAFTT